MNKKGVSVIVATVLIILITVAAVTIIWAAVIPIADEHLEPDFRVTIKQCWNETSEYNEYECDDGTILIFNYAYENRIETLTTTEGVYCSKNHDVQVNKFCKEVQVNEIEYIYKLCYDYGECLDKISYHNISVETLSIEWLNNNCKGYCYGCASDTLADMPCCGKGFSEYQCGDYKVEVIK